MRLRVKPLFTVPPWTGSSAARKLGLHHAHDRLQGLLRERGVAYDEFILTLWAAVPIQRRRVGGG